MADGTQGDGHADDTKLHGKPDKTLRFSLCSDNLEGISEGQFRLATPWTLNRNRNFFALAFLLYNTKKQMANTKKKSVAFFF